MFVAKHDEIADYQDNLRVKAAIPNVVDFQLLEDDDHLSMSFSKNMTYFSQVIKNLDHYRL